MKETVKNMDERDECSKVLDFKAEDILKATEMGLWSLRIYPDSLVRELHVDEMTCQMMGFPQGLTPVEYYEFWHSRITKEYYDYVKQHIQNMIKTGKIIQIQYIWKHPVSGDITIQCTGVRKDVSDDMTCIVGHFTIAEHMVKMNVLCEENASELTNKELAIELENQRMRDFYHASLSEAFAYAELDLESDQLQAAGGLWADCPQRFHKQGRKFIEFLVECQHQYVPAPSARNNFVTCENADEMYDQMLRKERSIIRYNYKRLLIKEWRWVQLTIYTFKEKYSQNMYALLYLKDIDAEKRQQEAAQTDALTGVFNRKVFEERVVVHMKNPVRKLAGAVILIDVDDFKNVNDKYGHLAGDEVLKHMANSLEETFGNNGVVGRFGGDEFIVFIEDDCKRMDIDIYMKQFIELFVQKSSIPVSCSAGITFIRDGAPSYQKILSLADEALYRSKLNGKNQYHFAEE